LGSLRGKGPVIPPIVGAQQDLKGGGLKGRLFLWVVGPAQGWGATSQVAGIPVVVDLVQGCGMVQARGRYPGVVWVWCSPRGGAERWVSRRVWVQHGAVAWCTLRGGEPAEWSCSSAGLWGRDLAGRLFFY
jgi:hypothetical protein